MKLCLSRVVSLVPVVGQRSCSPGSGGLGVPKWAHVSHQQAERRGAGPPSSGTSICLVVFARDGPVHHELSAQMPGIRDMPRSSPPPPCHGARQACYAAPTGAGNGPPPKVDIDDFVTCLFDAASPTPVKVIVQVASGAVLSAHSATHQQYTARLTRTPNHLMTTCHVSMNHKDRHSA
jgi:hypothetical protein